jgi:transcription initiation factor TFIIF subunit alpha
LKFYNIFNFRFGAGSEYGREAREEARRKKYGIITRRYKPEDQPWILKCGGKTGKKLVKLLAFII